MRLRSLSLAVVLVAIGALALSSCGGEVGKVAEKALLKEASEQALKQETVQALRVEGRSWSTVVKAEAEADAAANRAADESVEVVAPQVAAQYVESSPAAREAANEVKNDAEAFNEKYLPASLAIRRLVLNCASKGTMAVAKKLAWKQVTAQSADFDEAYYSGMVTCLRSAFPEAEGAIQLIAFKYHESLSQQAATIRAQTAPTALESEDWFVYTSNSLDEAPS
jgi:hypothetical protein